MTEFKFKVGDRVCFKTSKWIGTIQHTSVNWKPPMYYIIFEGTERPKWIEEDRLELVNEKETVIFT